VSSRNFKDPETARLWDEADKALHGLTAYLEKDTGRSFDDE
jgi:hypothetical protein